MAERQLILVRHGESTANAANVFTGWSDPPLTLRGEDEARSVAARLDAAGLIPTAVFTSVLARAWDTSRIIEQAMEITIPTIADAALNERDYGELTGLDKAAASTRWGADQIRTWRRAYVEGPPGGESLRDTVARVLPYYLQQILPSVLDGGTVLVVSHGNSLRALIMALDGLSPAEVETLELPTGSLRVYVLDPASRVVERRELAGSGPQSTTKPLPLKELP